MQFSLFVPHIPIHRIIEEEEVGVMITIDMNRMKQLRIQKDDPYVFSIEELRKDLKYIMDQYILYEGKFCVNVSAMTRQKLIEAYEDLEPEIDNAPDLPEEEIETEKAGACMAKTVVPVEQKKLGNDHLNLCNIPSESSGGRSSEDESGEQNVRSKSEIVSVNNAAKELNDKMARDSEKIRDYLRIFDDAMEEIILLMRKDSLLRFYETIEYETMCKDRKIAKVM